MRDLHGTGGFHNITVDTRRLNLFHRPLLTFITPTTGSGRYCFELTDRRLSVRLSRITQKVMGDFRTKEQLYEVF